MSLSPLLSLQSEHGRLGFASMSCLQYRTPQLDLGEVDKTWLQTPAADVSEAQDHFVRRDKWYKFISSIRMLVQSSDWMRLLAHELEHVHVTAQLLFHDPSFQ